MTNNLRVQFTGKGSRTTALTVSGYIAAMVQGCTPELDQRDPYTVDLYVPDTPEVRQLLSSTTYADLRTLTDTPVHTALVTCTTRAEAEQFVADLLDQGVVANGPHRVTRGVWTVRVPVVNPTALSNVVYFTPRPEIGPNADHMEVEVAIDDQGRLGVVDGPRCAFCIQHGVARCRHMGM